LYQNFSHRYSLDSSEITHIEKSKWKPLLPSTDRVTQRLIDRLFVVDDFNISINSNHHHHNYYHDDGHDNVIASFDHDGANFNDDDDSIEVVRIRFVGESFLTGQIRSIIGVLLSVFHGYLPMVMIIIIYDDDDDDGGVEDDDSDYGDAVDDDYGCGSGDTHYFDDDDDDENFNYTVCYEYKIYILYVDLPI
jgi:hypothetical protein